MFDLTFENFLYVFFIVVMIYVIKGAFEDLILLIAKKLEERKK